MNYILGIDFGHGETAASYMLFDDTVKIDKNQIKGVRLQPSTNKDQYKIASTIHQSKDGEYKLDAAYGNLKLAFKSKITQGLDIDAPLNRYSEHDQKIVNNLRAFRAFIKAVYSNALKYNSDVFQSDGANVDLYIAAPTKWTSDEKLAYKNFVEKALNRKVGWVISESEAAFFAKHEKGAVLVVDYGSSTIDYTLVIDNEKNDIDKCSNDTYGAGVIDQEFFNAYRNTDDYKEKLSVAKSELRRTGNMHIDIDSFILFWMRKAKEIAYTDNAPFIEMSGHLKAIAPDCNDVEFKWTCFDFEELINDYKSIIVKDFQDLKEEVDNVLRARGINCLSKIILSGGAAIMPWVSDSLSSIWGIDPVRDSTPSYVVSDGIVYYAAAQESGRKKIMDYLDKLDFMEMYKDCDTMSTRDIIEKLLPPVLAKYQNDTQHTTGEDLCDMLKEFFDGLTDRPEYGKNFRNSFNKKMSEKVNVALLSSLKEVFDYDLKCEIEMNLPQVPIVPFGEMEHSIRQWIESSAPNAFPFFKWNKSRKSSERIKLADGCYNAATSISLQYDFKGAENDFIMSLKTMITDKAMDIFNDRQLFKTIR